MREVRTSPDLTAPPQAPAPPEYHWPRVEPGTYFITFTTYGSRLHRERRGSYERNRDDGKTYWLEPNLEREQLEASELRHEPFVLDRAARESVARTIGEVASFKQWVLHGLNVRSNHVHLVISSTEPPERVMNALKSWATRRLREAGLVDRHHRVWTRHGSTRRLWKESDVVSVLTYVIDGQGIDLGGVRMGELD